MEGQGGLAAPQRGGAPTPTADAGLSAAQVADRRRRGLTNDTGHAPTRTIGAIVRANVVTRFNLLIGGLLAVILVVAPIQDALFGLVALSNMLIGIVQEVRAKRTLDRLALLSAPGARVVRDGQVQEVAVDEVVLDDVVVVGPGDQLAVDAEVLVATGLELDESLVTGESEPVPKQPGEPVLSGSFVTAGTGRVRATRVGRESLAGRLTEEARRFTLVHSELRAGIDRILRIVTWVLVPTALLLLVTQLLQDQGVRQALAGAVAGTIAMVPEGLVLLTSVAFAVAVVRLGRQQVLVQELPAVETLARVDVVAFDKTGTLTTGRIEVRSVEAVAADEHIEPALGALAAVDPEPNATLRAVAAAVPRPPGWHATTTVPFSSARKWSAASFARHGTWVLGAPDVLLAAVADGAPTRARAEELAATGQRVVLLAWSPDGLAPSRLPASLEPRALVVLGEDVRDDATETLAFFQAQAVRTLVISGDHPRTVGAVAERVGVPQAERPVAGDRIPADPAACADLAETRSVYGRVTPEQKRDLVRGLQAREHVVAMTGDGVNDVLALKAADIGIAVGEAATATRAVAQLVLLDGRFATLPSIIAEGRRVIGNIERVASLFLTKTVYATLLAIAVGVAQLPFPFLPRHLSLVGGLTIGIPGFFLALEPNSQRARTGFVRRTFAFAAPAGVAAAVATFAAYWLAKTVEPVTLEQARTTATITLFGMGVLVLRLLCRPRNPLRSGLLYGAVLAFLLVLVLPAGRAFFALEVPPLVVLLSAVGIVAIAGVVMETVVTTLETGQRLLNDDQPLRDRVGQALRRTRSADRERT